MRKALEKLKEEICTLPHKIEITDSAWSRFVKNCVVALMSGGEGSRFREVQGSKETNKNAFKLPNGDTMIEMAIRMYRDVGIKNFVALVYNQAHSIENLLGNGSKIGVNIKYSYDPDHPVGKGGAIKNALINKFIPKDSSLIVHNPDDVILNYKGSFPRDIVAGHLHGVSKGKIATVVIVKETPYTYTGMKIKDGNVERIEMYPMVPIPTHIGVTIFSPKSYDYFIELFDLTKKADFEKVLFPILAKEKKLYAVSIPNENWIPVNNLKAYKKLVKHLT